MIKRFASTLCGLVLAAAAIPAQAGYAGPYAGGPDDGFIGCDGVGECSITLDEIGNISGSFDGFFGPYDVTLTHIASSTGYGAVEVISYEMVGKGGLFSGAFRLVAGAIGFCDVGVSADGSTCLDATGAPTDLKGDVLVFRPGVIDANGFGHTIIDVLSDLDAPFVFATDFNVLEVGPEGNNGGVYQTGPTGWYCGAPDCSNPPDAQERMTFNFISDSTNDVPEPGSMALLGLGLAGLAATRRRKSA